MRIKKISIALLGSVAIGLIGSYPLGVYSAQPKHRGVNSKHTIAQVVAVYGQSVQRRLQPFFALRDVAYPPEQIALLAMKQEKKLELWARNGQAWSYVRTYPIRAASGVSGPKLREGDRQVPEGIYKIVRLNPNSKFHLSMKLNYPNAFDVQRALLDGRKRLGSNIFIHGKARSTGCLAIGDSAIEELFILTETVGVSSAVVIIAPRDIRKHPLEHIGMSKPNWLPELYDTLSTELTQFSANKTNKLEVTDTEDGSTSYYHYVATVGGES